MLTLCVPVASWATGTGAGSNAAVGNTHVRHGKFGQPIVDAGFVSPVDLTVVADEQLPSSVHSSFGLVGIDAGWAGDASGIVNQGTIHSIGADFSDIVGVHDVTVVHGGDVFAVSDGLAAVQYSGNYYVNGTDNAVGIYVYNAGNSTVETSGKVIVNATAATGAANAVGVHVVGVNSADITNSGTISVTASGDQATAFGLINQSYLTATTTNTGTITVAANGNIAPYGSFEAVATGVYTYAVMGDAVVNNSGSVSVTATAMADISNTTDALTAHAIGVRAVNPSGNGEALISNSGDISASAVVSQGNATAWGAVAQSGSSYTHGNGDAEIDNDSGGSISSSAKSDLGVSTTTGAYIHSGNTAVLVNHGDISATSQGGRGYAYVDQNNPGSNVQSYATGANVYGFGYGSGGSSITNSGTIEAHASIDGGYNAVATAIKITGSSATLDNAAGATIYATADTELFGIAQAVGIQASATYNIGVVNDGSIVAYGHAHAYDNGTSGYTGASGAVGVEATATSNPNANISVVNHGDISAHAVSDHSLSWSLGGAGATGISAYAKYNAVIESSGTISAISNTEFGDAVAYGASGKGKHYTHIINDASGSIVASATAGSLLSDVYGGRAVSMGTKVYGATQAVIYNAGSIVSTAVANADGGANQGHSSAQAWGATIGAYSTDEVGSVINHGDIEASATAEFGDVTSFGTYVRDITTDSTAVVVSSTSNSGTITSAATANYGNAQANGTYLVALRQLYYVQCDANHYNCQYPGTLTPNGGVASLDNSGEISAVATAHGGTGYAYGASVLGAFNSGITNSGHISSSVDADKARAVGALTNSLYGYATLQNSGSISAVATGKVTSASGVFIAGAYGNTSTDNMAAMVDNQGSITAKGTGTTSATAIGIEATGWKTDGIQINSSGTIGAAAYGPGATATAISMASNGSNVLTNSGRLGAYGDGARIAVFSSAGATATIVNTGSITGAILTGDLDDSLDNAAGASWHAVGSSDFGGGDDHVVNHGTLFMDDAAIDLGGYVDGNTFDNFGTIKASGSANVIDMSSPFPLNNNGVISFVNGAPNDVLTIGGDLGGTGVISVDVSGAHLTSDQLHVKGNVVSSATQTINVNLLDAPTAPSVDIPVVIASGTLGGTFTLGQVQYVPRGFVSVGFGVKMANRIASLVVDVTGLNGAGSVATAVAPGTQSLVNSEVGTWRQRMGVVPEQSAHGVAPWVRAFSDSGDVNPARGGNFGTGGSSDFHQSNQGLELGLDTRLLDHLSAGVLIGKVDGSQRLTGSNGSDRLDGRTFGLYGTWLGDNGFYFDVSQRWISVRAHLRSATAAPMVDASAAAFNVETGITALTMAGIDVVPQMQYTRTRIDSIAPLNVQQSEFANHGGVSSRGRLGVAFDKTIQGSRFTWTPYGSINAVREFNGRYAYAIDNSLTGTTTTQGTSAMVEAGLGVRRGAFSITGGVNWTDGGALQNIIGGQLVARYDW